jgi:hypothetical protein
MLLVKMSFARRSDVMLETIVSTFSRPSYLATTPGLYWLKSLRGIYKRFPFFSFPMSNMIVSRCLICCNIFSKSRTTNGASRQFPKPMIRIAEYSGLVLSIFWDALCLPACVKCTDERYGPSCEEQRAARYTRSAVEGLRQRPPLKHFSPKASVAYGDKSLQTRRRLAQSHWHSSDSFRIFRSTSAGSAEMKGDAGVLSS